MATRLLIVTFALALIVVLMLWFKRNQLLRARAAASAVNVDASSDQVPTLIYFWSEGCSQCRSVQAPIVERLHDALGSNRLRVNKIDIGKDHAQAKTWGVRTVPTTYVVDINGEVKYVNNGLAGEHVLRRQLDSLGVW